MNLERILETLKKINEFGDTGNGITRLAYTDIERKVAAFFKDLCQKEGLSVYQDECGNIIARRKGMMDDLPAVACGSHLDTVINGGRYDGALGVVAGLEVIRSLNEKNIKTLHPIEVIAFACEESARFGVSTIGSKAMAGKIIKESLKDLEGIDGKKFSDAFSACGLDFDQIDLATRSNQELEVFYELHIEQGPVLEQENKQIGIVTGIAAPTRYELFIRGKASHSGTTPMHLRKDAFLGAAEIALQIENAAKEESTKGTVATVGFCQVWPGAMNVIPDTVEMKVDIRGTNVASKRKVIEKLNAVIETVKINRKLDVVMKELCDELPILLPDNVTQNIAKGCSEIGATYMYMPSGAGHDAMNMAAICPTGLIFLPSIDGLSHHPDEYTNIEQIGMGVSLLENVITNSAKIYGSFSSV